MSELRYIFGAPYRSSDDRNFPVQTRGAPSGHVWRGRLALLPFDGEAELETDRETTQPNRDALAYWVRGLGSRYFDEAFERASQRQRRPGEQLLA